MFARWRGRLQRKDPRWAAPSPSHPRESLLTDGVDVFPWLSPVWYRCRYPDVEAAGVAPLVHYLHHGAAEKRDPSGLFSTRWYLAQYPDVAESGENPLLHYLRIGMSEGRAPRPELAPGIYGAPRVAVVLIAAGPHSLAAVTLASLALAKTEAAADVVLVDCGQSDDVGPDAATRARLSRAGLALRTIAAAGASFSAAVNRGMAAALATPATHICVLRAGTMCPSGWLDDLVAAGEPVVAPLCDVAHAPLAPEALAVQWPVFDSFAEVWRNTVSKKIVPAASFDGCFLIHRGAALHLGPLKAVADNPREAYFVRLQQKGLEPKLLPYSYVRFAGEAALAEGPEAAIALAHCADFITPETPREEMLLNMLRAVTASCERQAADLRDGSILASLPVSRSEATTAEVTQASPHLRWAYRRALSNILEALDRREPPSARVLLGFQALSWSLAQIMAEHPFLLVLAGADPVNGDEKDGYVQRIKAIDAALSNVHRVYVAFRDQKLRAPRLQKIAQSIWRLEINEGPLGAIVLEGVARCAAGIYCHSIYPLQSRSARALLDEVPGPFVLDLHGAVPEECKLFDDPYHARIFAGIERQAVESADRLVCVSRQMSLHIQEKYGPTKQAPILCPIFTPATVADLDNKSYNARPRVIYAGGLQRWQQVDAMVDLVADVSPLADFLFLTQETQTLKEKFSGRGLKLGEGLSVRAASQQDVFDAYAQCDFGLLLRAASPVNRVACPTKLIEYLASGVIPVLDTTEVGDFVDIGMSFVPLEAFRRGDIPDPEERRRMARANIAVGHALEAQSRDGLAGVRGIFGADATSQGAMIERRA